MERIITSRLEGFVETNDILDEEQEGFRHYRSTTNALLNLYPLPHFPLYS
jgi:hypothetical protein